ncbi:MAG TPA: hypothetical protein VHX15_06930 [Frankiaceae bacterium]|nr:hypothetical protein [Frankiaceae bacterium]
MAATAGARILADSVGPGGTAALVVLVLIIATIAIFVGLLGSLKRLRQNARTGKFHGADPGPHETHGRHEATGQQMRARKSEQPVTPDPGSDGAGA